MQPAKALAAMPQSTHREFAQPKPSPPALVSNLMTAEVKVVEPGASLADVHNQFSQHALHHLPVVEGDRLIRLISQIEVIRAGVESSHAPRSNASETRLLARDIMVDRVSIVTAGPDTTIREAAAMLSNGYFHALPLVDARDRLLGIVTSTDLCGYLAAVLEPRPA
jgi:CBS-domain-containing membrane protein